MRSKNKVRAILITAMHHASVEMAKAADVAEDDQSPYFKAKVAFKTIQTDTRIMDALADALRREW